MWEEVVEACIKVLTESLLGGTKEMVLSIQSRHQFRIFLQINVL
jgi:hypothetical protein